MYKEIDMESWVRSEHFKFFSDFDEPFFGITAEIDCIKGYEKCKGQGLSFFSYYLYKSLEAVNEIPEFRFRLVDNRVVQFNAIHASFTVAREDTTFGIALAEFDKDFKVFNQAVSKGVAQIKETKGFSITEDVKRPDTIHYSAIPWVRFKGLTHARKYNIGDTSPKISFGKAVKEDGKLMMPVALFGHHGFMDGLHAGLFFELFQKKMM